MQKIFFKNVLFFAAVHGNETVGVEILKKVIKANWIIGNQNAYTQKIRYTNIDLNRVAPGIKNSKQYEFRRAVEILEIAKKYKYIIDLHETKSDSPLFIIITKNIVENLLLAFCLPISNIVIWQSEKKKNFGPLTRYVDCGIEIECNRKNKNKLYKIISNLEKTNKDLKNKKIFKVIGKIEQLKNIKNRFKNFQQAKLDNEKFYPLLIGEYKNIFCYKMQRIF